MDMTVQKAKRIVVKVGSSLVTNNGEGLDHGAIAMWAEQLAALLRSGHEVLMEVDDNSVLIVGDLRGILGKELMLYLIHLLNIMIILISHIIIEF